MLTLWGSEREPQLNKALSEWAAWKIFGARRSFGPCTTLGVFNDDAKLIGVMVYHNLEPDTGVIEISGAADDPRWLTPAVLWEMFSYPFGQLGCQAIVMRVPSGNRRLHRILTAYKFTCHTLPRLRGRDADENVFILTDDDWQHNGFHRKERHGQVETSRAA